MSKFKKIFKVNSKKEKVKKVRVNKVKSEQAHYGDRNNFNLKTNKWFYLGVTIYTLLLFGVIYFIFGSTLAVILLIPYTFFLVLAMVMDRKKERSFIRKIIKSILTATIILGIIGIMLFAAFFMYIAITAPKFDSDKLNNDEKTIIYDKNNTIITTIGLEKREKLNYNELSDVLVDAIIATEDSRFFQHNGLDAPRFFKATVGQLTGNSEAGGGSTITMQVVKNNFTSTTRSGIRGIIRKFTDIYLAIFKMEAGYTKEEIFEFYVNDPFLGSKSYGVEQASLTYFGKSAKNLNLAEASLIAGLFQAPGAYDPNINPEAATQRRKTVLALMRRHGYITKEEEDIANSIPVKDLLIPYNSSNSPYQGYIDLVIDEITEKTGMDPYVVPMLIYTNMDKKKQDGINDIMNGKGYKWKDKTIQAGIAAVEVNSGKIVAIGAGRNRTGERTFSYAVDIKRQIGSTAKPIFDYGPGIEFNNWSTYTLFKDEPYQYSNGTKIKNWDNKYLGTLTLRQALAKSRNIPAVQAFQQIDNQKIIEFVTSLGITPEIVNGYIHEAHAIGGFNGSNPLELAAAFAAFSNGGYYYEPYSVNKIVLRNEAEETTTFSSTPTRVMSEETAYMITNILYNGVNSGDIGIARISGVALAGKTGTTDYDQKTRDKYKLSTSAVNDAWIIGYTPTLSVGLWYGYDTITKGVYNTMSQASYQRKVLFSAISKVMFSKTSSWKQPTGVVSSKIEKGSNPAMLPSSYTPSDQIVTELFKKGSTPTEVSSKYVPLPTPQNVNVTYSSGTSTITWDDVTPHENINTTEYGAFGYEVYYNGAYLGFTTLTTYTYDTTYPYGTYMIKAAYNKIKTNRSSGGSYTLLKDASLVNLTVQLNSPTSSETIPIGSNYVEPSPPVLVFDNMIDVTSLSTITKNIYNSSNAFIGTSISSLNAKNNEPGTYRIEYTAVYSGITKTINKTIIFQ